MQVKSANVRKLRTPIEGRKEGVVRGCGQAYSTNTEIDQVGILEGVKAQRSTDRGERCQEAFRGEGPLMDAVGDANATVGTACER